MASPSSLDSGDREFFRTVAATAFCNPFSKDRLELDEKILGHPVSTAPEEHLDELSAAITARVEKLEGQKRADLRQYTGSDRALMQTVFLFEAYHRYCRDFDQLILAQVKLGNASAPVPFAGAALRRIRARGIGAAEANRYFAIFYQLRRAYYFIVRGLVGQSPCMSEFRRQLWNCVFTQDVQRYDRYLWNRMEDFSTLLLGETGTGKGRAAAAIGRSGFVPFDEKTNRFSESFMRGFMALNLSQFPETLIESELFGHRKGAFTGAIEAHEGALARCSPHGSIFLDEIGDVSVPVQIKLLQVLQERRFCPVGSHETRRFSGRVIAATNRSLGTLRGHGLFREDFFYRLCSDVILVPPLRQRIREAPAELEVLLAHVLTGILGAPARELEQQVAQKLRATVGEAYHWPGNVRELEQAVRRILLTDHYAASTPANTTDVREQLMAGIETESMDADTLLGRYCALLYERSGNYETVARQTKLDRRTVKRYLHLHSRNTLQPYS